MISTTYRGVVHKLKPNITPTLSFVFSDNIKNNLFGLLRDFIGSQVIRYKLYLTIGNNGRYSNVTSRLSQNSQCNQQSASEYWNSIIESR